MADQNNTPSAAAGRTMSKQAKVLQGILEALLDVWTMPYRRAFKKYTWRPLRKMRAADDNNRSSLIKIVKDWKDDKYNELQAVQVAATFCGGANFSCLPWARSAHAIWATEALWYISLICAISAIITSIQTKSILDDLPTCSRLESPTSLTDVEVERMMRAILRYKKRPGFKHWVMLYIWQYPSMTMAYAWVCYLGGLTLYVCNPLFKKLEFGDAHRSTIVYLVVALISLVTYVSAIFFVHSNFKDLMRSVSSSASSSPRIHEIELGIHINFATTPSAVRMDASQSTQQSVSVMEIACRHGGKNPHRLLFS